MASSNFLPDREPELVTWIGTFKSLITANPTTYGLTAAQATAYGTLATNFVNAYNVARADATRSPSNIIAKDDAKFLVVKNTRVLAGIVQKYPGTTDQMRSDLGLNVPAQRQPIPPPGVRPGMDVISVANRTVTVRVHDSASSVRRGKPAGVATAWVYSFVGEEYPSDPLLWSFEGSTTRGKFSIVFPNTVAGGTQVWLCAAWVNAKQEAGPTSVPITTNLQGGGTSSEQAELKVAA